MFYFYYRIMAKPKHEEKLNNLVDNEFKTADQYNDGDKNPACIVEGLRLP